MTQDEKIVEALEPRMNDLNERALLGAATAALNARRAANGWPPTSLDKMLTADREAWVEDVRAAITAYQAEAWQPMSTAPKDTPVFLWGYLEVSSHSRPLIGSDDRYEAYWSVKAEAWRCYNYEGWIVIPFAWMPLPPPFKGSGSRLADATPNPPASP